MGTGKDDTVIGHRVADRWALILVLCGAPEKGWQLYSRNIPIWELFSDANGVYYRSRFS